MQDASPSAEPSRRSYILLGERVLIPATLKNSTTGYKNVNYDRGNNKFKRRGLPGEMCGSIFCIYGFTPSATR